MRKIVFMVFIVSVALFADQQIANDLNLLGHTLKGVKSFSKPGGTTWNFIESNQVVQICTNFDGNISNAVINSAISRDTAVSNALSAVLTNTIAILTNAALPRAQWANVASVASNLINKNIITYDMAWYDNSVAVEVPNYISIQVYNNNVAIDRMVLLRVWLSNSLDPNGEIPEEHPNPVPPVFEISHGKGVVLKTVTTGKQLDVLTDKDGSLELKVKFDHPEPNVYLNIKSYNGVVTNSSSVSWVEP
jgi:hypothetical protein